VYVFSVLPVYRNGFLACYIVLIWSIYNLALVEYANNSFVQGIEEVTASSVRARECHGTRECSKEVKITNVFTDGTSGKLIVICLLIYNPAEHFSYICTLDTSINYLFMIHVLHQTWQKVSYMMIHQSQL